MKNEKELLVDRLGVKKVNKLLKWSKKHPKRGELIFFELCHLTDWCDLSYRCVYYLDFVLECGFKPNKIRKLFKNKK
jgi:hypothetical protein